MKSAVATLALLASLALPAFSSDKRLTFDPGAVASTVSHNFSDGGHDTWRVSATSGQTLTVQIASEDNNGVFQIYGPDQKALPGAAAGDDDTFWSAPLTAPGDYRIVVGSNGGICAYKLRVILK
jgi:hypothetical protein